MRWTRGHQSSYVDDRRAHGGRRAGGLGGAGLLMWLLSRFGLPGLLVGGVALYLMSQVGSQGTQDGAPHDASQRAIAGGELESEREQEAVEFVSFVLDDVQATWRTHFAQRGARYEPARLVIFREQTHSACGVGDAQTGPFYCPRDRNAYIDLSFYDELKQRFGAPGDFAQAYVIAHEIGHHVQHLLGTTERVANLSGQRSGEQSAAVRLELQADCYAGVWAHSTQQRELLEAGDLEEAMGAAAAIGDDRLQRSATGRVSPETFTHGSSEQRMRWFRTGFERGDAAACDTFSARSL